MLELPPELRGPRSAPEAPKACARSTGSSRASPGRSLTRGCAPAARCPGRSGSPPRSLRGPRNRLRPKIHPPTADPARPAEGGGGGTVGTRVGATVGKGGGTRTHRPGPCQPQSGQMQRAAAGRRARPPPPPLFSPTRPRTVPTRTPPLAAAHKGSVTRAPFITTFCAPGPVRATCQPGAHSSAAPAPATPRGPCWRR